MKIIISGGGTGGHIYPAITLIRTIQNQVKNLEILYVGTKIGLEADIIPKEGLPFQTVDIRGLERKLSLKMTKTIGKAIHGVWQARRIVKQFKPDVVIGTGGFVCGPILLAASLMGIPTLIQEQNVIPGITNKLLAKFVTKIAVGYQDAVQYFPKEKVVFTGNPIRAEVLSMNRQAGLAEFGFDTNKKTILISGGSRGARSMNRAMIDVHKHFACSQNIQLLHVTGKNEYNDIVASVQEQGLDLQQSRNILIKPYLYDMPKALALADLAIFRAGATGIAELTAKGIPSILIPYPYAAENHQEFNALALVKRGAAVMIRDKDLTSAGLIEAIESIISEPVKLLKMATASREMGRPEAAEEIAKIVILLADQGLKKLCNDDI
ncbi:UDP-N-acetylglucosamine-N-acetylmuramylpentapeptide N-acetylglucosamine transferase [Propionispira arboris]|uniref:UDP-N-acetylglucosamine--N-acetylmuramyl-(pentapeptide) pyrophosphoryl-undecaprenol N-acetylglucosamine transferase n=1 Tax=Propionispira arboris TaxID=84035 RepID=A0A1H7ADY9_9FIRM|nr:undecaprenyldiphospho-muramoylpentapeptide beta-N-acetylglucosaminyltransferase [Propionispira arboris]SEJ63809.1 UDP-N-acetylglucosamine-N-acetylmuramylpentapeptide N-acetylglucosamine transferase [Propionispira arboris]